jgi:hypothetical protein
LAAAAFAGSLDAALIIISQLINIGIRRLPSGRRWGDHMHDIK